MQAEKNNTNTVKSWIMRVIQGALIGTGFIIPGISGGALAAIFGLYERIISFLANITDNFMKNVKFFLPVGIGAIIGIGLSATVLSSVLENYQTIATWFFVGAMVGMLPSLWRTAGEQGRDKVDIGILVASFIGGFIILAFGRFIFDFNLSPSFWTWMLCGFLIAMGLLVPGLSPSNFIVYMGMYQEMSEALSFGGFDLSAVIPLVLGALLTIFLFSKLIERIFQKHYSKFYHFIFGIVLASTLMIIPTDYSGFGFGQYLACVLTFAAGAALGAWMESVDVDREEA